MLFVFHKEATKPWPCNSRQSRTLSCPPGSTKIVGITSSRFTEQKSPHSFFCVSFVVSFIFFCVFFLVVFVCWFRWVFLVIIGNVDFAGVADVSMRERPKIAHADG